VSNLDWDWYWREPFTNRESRWFFDRDYWWVPKSGWPLINRFSATFEVLRRHPLVGEIFTAEPADTLSSPPNGERRKLAYCLWCIGRASWAKLEPSDRDWFQEVLRSEYPQKGQDITAAIHNITAEATDPTMSNPRAVLEQYVRLAEIARLAIEHDQQGRLILAVDIRVPNRGKAEKALVRFFKQQWKKPLKSGRTAQVTWLQTISDFEKDRMHNPKKFSRSVKAAKAFKKLLSGFQF